MEAMIRYLRTAKKNELRGTVLLRLDFNTEDDWRMKATLPTVKFLLKTSSRIVIVSHHGRPVGVDKKLSLKKNAVTLSKWLGKKVIFVPHFDFANIKTQIEASPRGSVFLLENLRFNPGEEKNDPKFAKQLASLADFYVNDSFAVDHRANASLVAVTNFLPSFAGLELEREITSLSRAIKNPKHPIVFVAGGAKAADKLEAITYFKNKADCFLLGGGPANTILSLGGMDIKKSIRDTDPADVKEMKSFTKLKKVVVPVDFRWHGEYIWDIGPETEKLFAKKIAAAKTIIWTGPLGFIEKPAFARGSIAVAKAIGKNRKAFSLTGGGETVMFLKKYKLDKKISFISTGGGAMIDFLAGKKLPGIAALTGKGGAKK
jgi:3-phosphoglycerate kinase